MTTPNFKLICIEGADKSGKTTLSNEIRQRLPNINYWHFTSCDHKSGFAETDIPLQRNVNVFHQFYRFFDQHFYHNSRSLCNKTYLLDRTLYSDIVYGPIYRGHDDKLVVRDIEKNYFTLLLNGLGCVFIFAENGDATAAFNEIVTENEGVINSLPEFASLRASYRLLIQNIHQSTDMPFLFYNFNLVDRVNFVENMLKSALNKPNPVVDDLVKRNALGQLIGTTTINKNTKIIRVPGDPNYIITLQDYANLVVDMGMEDLSVDSPLMATNKVCIVRKNSIADEIVTVRL